MIITTEWMHVFDSLWPMHFAHILEVASHIMRLTRLMRTEIRLEHIQQEYEFRKDALEGFKAQKREARRQEFHRIMSSLSPCRYDDTLYRLRGRRCKETGDWLFIAGTFKNWLNSSQEENRILWLKGIPGSGRNTSFYCYFQFHELFKCSNACLGTTLKVAHHLGQNYV